MIKGQDRVTLDSGTLYVTRNTNYNIVIIALNGFRYSLAKEIPIGEANE